MLKKIKKKKDLESLCLHVKKILLVDMGASLQKPVGW